MSKHKSKINLILLPIFLISLLSVILFPIVATNQTTFSQLRQDKKATTEKYKDEWLNTSINRLSKPDLKYISGDQVATITIPKMNLYEYPVYYGSDPINNNWQITSPGYLGNWSMFGESGVTCVGAHNYQLFKDLKTLKPGDKILVETDIDRYVYVVDATDIYDNESDNWTKVATKHNKDYALNLMTCYPFDAVKTKDMYIVYTSLQKGTIFE